MNQKVFKKRMKEAGFSEDDIIHMAANIIIPITEDKIATGEVNPAGKNASQITAAVAKDLLRRLRPESRIAYSVSHQDELLELARAHGRKGGGEMACLFYATWLEHWVNLILFRSPCKLDAPERNQMLRELSLRAKFSWVLVLLGYPRLQKAHLDRIARISEIRNAYVHYKWQPKLMEHADDEKQQRDEELAGVEKTIRYLNRFEDKYQLKGKKMELARLFPKRSKQK